jgi:hypothetical protein
VNEQAAIAFVRAEFEREEQTGFARLAKIPDTHVWRFLRYFRGLKADEAAALKAALARRGCRLLWQHARPLTFREEQDAAFNALRAGIGRVRDFRLESLKMLKMAVGLSQSDDPRAKAQMKHVVIPPDIIEWVNGLTTCKATTMRKLVKVALKSRFGLKSGNEGGGEWAYRDPGGQGKLEVQIDYGGTWGQQLRYTVSLHEPSMAPSPPPSFFPYLSIPGWVRGLNYERILGVGSGDWDFMTEGNADQSIALLTDLIEDTARIARTVRPD